MSGLWHRDPHELEREVYALKEGTTRLKKENAEMLAVLKQTEPLLSEVIVSRLPHESNLYHILTLDEVQRVIAKAERSA